MPINANQYRSMSTNKDQCCSILDHNNNMPLGTIWLALDQGPMLINTDLICIVNPQCWLIHHVLNFCWITTIIWHAKKRTATEIIKWCDDDWPFGKIGLIFVWYWASNTNIPILPEAFLTFASKCYFSPSYASNDAQSCAESNAACCKPWKSNCCWFNWVK